MLFFGSNGKVGPVSADSDERKFNDKMPTASGSDLRPLFLFCQILGVTPANVRFKFSSTLWLSSFLMVGIFNVVVFCTQVYAILSNWGKWDMIRIVLQVVTRAIRFLIVISHFYVLQRKKKLHRKIMNTVSVSSLSTMNLYYRGVFCIVLLSLMFVAYGLLVYDQPSTFTMNMMSAVQFSQIICLLLLFCSYVEIATSEIAQNAAILCEKFRVNWLVDKHLTRLQHLRCVNKFFDLQLFLTHAFLTYYFVYSCFSIITHLGDKNYVLVVAYVCFHLTCFLSILLINRACQDNANEAEKFNAELFRLMRENQELCKNEKLQLYVTMKQTVNFTACGFFTLGYPLVTSIIAAATTYLVILVQFSMPPPKT